MTIDTITFRVILRQLSKRSTLILFQGIKMYYNTSHYFPQNLEYLIKNKGQYFQLLTNLFFLFQPIIAAVVTIATKMPDVSMASSITPVNVQKDIEVMAENNVKVKKHIGYWKCINKFSSAYIWINNFLLSFESIRLKSVRNISIWRV